MNGIIALSRSFETPLASMGAPWAMTSTSSESGVLRAGHRIFSPEFQHRPSRVIQLRQLSPGRRYLYCESGTAAHPAPLATPVNDGYDLLTTETLLLRGDPFPRLRLQTGGA